MKLYLISQTKNRDYDKYNAAVVCASDEESARKIQPDGGVDRYGQTLRERTDGRYYIPEWVEPEFVSVVLIGEASEHVKHGVVLSSFNAS